MSNEDYCYVVDIGKSFAWNNPQQIRKQNLSPNYIPVEDAFFEESDCPNFNKLQDFVSKAKILFRPKNSVNIKPQWIYI